MEMGEIDVRMREDMDWVGCWTRGETDHLPEIDPAGLPFFGPPPQPAEIKKRNGKRPARLKKRMLIFHLNC